MWYFRILSGTPSTISTSSFDRRLAALRTLGHFAKLLQPGWAGQLPAVYYYGRRTSHPDASPCGKPFADSGIVACLEAGIEGVDPINACGYSVLTPWFQTEGVLPSEELLFHLGKSPLSGGAIARQCGGSCEGSSLFCMDKVVGAMARGGE
jgi:hypothetical protein